VTLLQASTHAQTLAGRNFESNLEALDRTQPQLRPWVTDQILQVEWVAARDGSLSALDHAGQWWGGCSLPLRAARAMLARLELRGAVACFLSPTHAGQLRAAMDRLRREQAVVAIVPDMRDLAFILHCDDFTHDLRDHRLWFAAGPGWDVGLRQVFDDQPGLATPTQFIRMQDADASVVDEMISMAQGVFSEISTVRAAAIQTMKQNASAQRTGAAPSRTRLCVVAPSRFRLWNDLSGAMLGIFQGQNDIDVEHFDCDDPACSSPLALLKAASSADAMFTANTGRTDLPGLVSESTPWITWVTAGRVPSSALAGIDDHLIVVDESLRAIAIKSGWAEARVHVAAWPQAGFLRAGSAKSSPSLAIIVDTFCLDTPDDLTEYSSHGLLWEAMRNEILRDPMALDGDVNAFLNHRMRQLGVSEDAFPRGRFIEKLILPAYQQGLARILLANKIPLKLYGGGWDKISAFKDHARGPVQSRDQLAQAVNEAAAVVHVWPNSFPHPIDALDVPIVRRTGRRFDAFVRDARAALAGRQPAVKLRNPAVMLSFDMIRRIVANVGR
jgi:hypothetical protein